MSPYPSSSPLLEGLLQQSIILWAALAFPTTIPMSACAVCEFHTVFPGEGKITMNALVNRMRVGYDIKFKTMTGLDTVL